MTETSPVPVEDLRLHRGDQQLAYKAWGNPANPPVLALHGWRDNAATFDRLAPLLIDYYVLALDFAGHGLSSPRHRDGAYTIWSYLDDVLLLLNQLKIPACHLLGHSMGGAVGTLFAALFPERMNKLVLLDILGPLPVSPEESVAQMRKSLLQKQEWDPGQKSYYESYQAAVEARARVGLEFDSALLLASRGVAQDEGGFYWSSDRRLARANMLSMTEAHVQAFLRQISCPGLFIQASDAQYWDRLVDVLQPRMAAIANLQHILLPGHHHQHLEGQVPRVADLVNDFLAA